MNNLDELASICSVLFTSYSDDEKSSPKNALFDPNKSKSNMALNFTCIDDIRNLHIKGLVEKFSEPTSDEIKRRYSYKCMILPDECDTVYESYGSEKKACDSMRHHLQLHLQDLEDRISSGQWPPKTDEKKVLRPPKGSKRSLKYEHPLGIKMPRKKHSKKTLPRERNNGLRKPPKLKIPDCHKLNNSMNSKHTGFLVNPKIEPNEENTVVEEIVQDLTVEICGPLCPHVNCSLSEPSTSAKTDNSNDLVVQSVALEHSYAYKKGIKPSEEHSPPHKNGRSSYRKGCCIPTDLVIKTPPFPYVHVPLLPDCAGIELVIMEGEFLSDLRETGGGDDPVVTVKQSIKRARIPSSVLECVENRVDVSTTMRVPNSPSLSPEHSNEENAENVQKAEREKALRCISKLKAKKKKQYQGPLECQICKHKKFTALATLIHHYRSHAGIKPYSCKLCEGTFTRKHSLNYHMLIHKNISRFTCPSCFRAFRHPSHYKEHLRRHTGETPFICPTCLLKFKTRNTFKRHLKIQHRKLLTAHGILDLPTLEAP
nr:uncharacterized protein LOC107441553 [Parasteatoda tepidariorum]